MVTDIKLRQSLVLVDESKECNLNKLFHWSRQRPQALERDNLLSLNIIQNQNTPRAKWVLKFQGLSIFSNCNIGCIHWRCLLSSLVSLLCWILYMDVISWGSLYQAGRQSSGKKSGGLGRGGRWWILSQIANSAMNRKWNGGQVGQRRRKQPEAGSFRPVSSVQTAGIR